MKDIFERYKVVFNFVTNLCASVPANPDLTKKWLESRQPRVKPPSGKSIDVIQEEILASLPEETEPTNMLIFQRNNGNLVLRAATIRAHLKDCARIVSSLYVGKIQGEKSFATKVVNGIYVEEEITSYWMPILRPDGTFVTNADGTIERPVKGINPRTGVVITALKVFEFVNPARIDFTLKILGGCIKEKDLETLLMYGGTHGYGGERGNGEGRYVATIQATKEVKEKEMVAAD